MYTDRLVQWLQNTLLHQESLVFHVSDVACDFVRDDDGRWWLLQVRSLPLSSLSLSSSLPLASSSSHPSADAS